MLYIFITREKLTDMSILNKKQLKKSITSTSYKIQLEMCESGAEKLRKLVKICKTINGRGCGRIILVKDVNSLIPATILYIDTQTKRDEVRSDYSIYKSLKGNDRNNIILNSCIRCNPYTEAVEVLEEVAFIPKTKLNELIKILKK